jgi:hypothetical protein
VILWQRGSFHGFTNSRLTKNARPPNHASFAVLPSTPLIPLGFPRRRRSSSRKTSSNPLRRPPRCFSLAIDTRPGVKRFDLAQLLEQRSFER